jgi:hypothetical protein
MASDALRLSGQHAIWEDVAESCDGRSSGRRLGFDLWVPDYVRSNEAVCRRSRLSTNERVWNAMREEL